MNPSGNQPYIGRFAPSPTGPLHQGSVIAAVASYLDARANNGKWLLRIEDVDQTRCKPEYATHIIATLAALGFRWDGEIETQSQLTPRYTAALKTLIDQNLVYACTCSRKEIADSALPGLDGSVYAGTCRQARHDFAGNTVRVITTNSPLSCDDAIQGQHVQRLESMIGDFVVRRRDQLFSYQLAVVADDYAQGVTHIVRGADLLDSTPRQVYLQRLLGYPTPQYAHIPVATNEQGQKLSKQTLATAVSSTAAAHAIREALKFLQQPAVDISIASPGDILSHAAAKWNLAYIPVERGIPYLER